MSISLNRKYVLGSASAGGGVGGSHMEWVVSLPETGEADTLYLVYTGNTRQGYSIYQQFVWNATDEEWDALGAFDTTIVQQGLLYEKSFDATTGVWVVRATPSN